MTLTKTQLENLYVNQKLTLEEIAKKTNLSKSQVFRLVKKYQFSKNDHRTIQSPSKEELVELYENQNMNIRDIAKKYNVNRATIRKWFRQYKIESRWHKAFPIPPKDELETLYVYMKKEIKEIAEIYKVNRNLVAKWLANENIALYIPEKDILVDFYENHKLTLKQIGQIYDVSKSTVTRWFIKYNIKIDSNQRRYYHLRAIPLTQLQQEFVIGTMLGDGCLTKRGKYTRMSMTHGEEWFGYLLWKKNIMGNFVNTIYRGKEQKNRNNCVNWSWASIYLNGLNFYYSLFYENNIKVIRKEIIHYLTPFAMAIWVMDDGWNMSECNIRISSESFSKEENEILVHAIKINFDINSKVCQYERNNKKYYYISFNKRNSILLTKLIKPYIIPSMEYKILNLDKIEKIAPQRLNVEHS